MNAAEQTAAGPDGGDPSPPSSGGRRSRWPRRVTALALLLGAALLVGPPLAGGWLRGEFERLASAEIHGEVTLEGLSLRLNGKIDLEGLRVVDEAGETVLFSPRGMIDVGLRSWLTGRKDLAVHVYGSELDLVRDGQGGWNVERLVASDPAADSDGPSPDAPGEGSPSGGDTPAPRRRPLDLHGRIEFADCTVVVRSPESALQLADVTFTVGLDGPEQSTAVRLEGHVFGGTGSVGDFYADLFLWPDAGPGLEIDRVDVTDLELGVLREAMRIAGVEADEELSFAGTADVHLEGGAEDLRADAPYAVQATAELRGLRVEYPDGAGGLASIVEEAPVRLRAELASAGEGASPGLEGVLEARGGQVRLDVAADPELRAALRLDGASLDATLAPLVARLHPAAPLPSGAALASGALGLVDATVSMGGVAPGRWSDPSAWSGTGSLTLREVDLTRSPLVTGLLDGLGASGLLPAIDRAGVETARVEATRPLNGSLAGGRVTYPDPWTWTIGDLETTFTGSVGLDRTVDLRWNLPVDAALAGSKEALRWLEGETLSVEVGGTLARPTLDVNAAIGELLDRAASGGLGRALERELGLGGGDSGTSPAALLREADRRWSEGDRAGAAPIYRRIRDEFPLSPVYLLNRDRIKARRNG